MIKRNRLPNISLQSLSYENSYVADSLPFLSLVKSRSALTSVIVRADNVLKANTYFCCPMICRLASLRNWYETDMKLTTGTEVAHNPLHQLLN